MMPIEFARQSSGDRITLVITPGALPVRTLWAAMRVSDLRVARSALAEREGVREQNIDKYIGNWASNEQSSDRWTEAIGRWAHTMTLDAVVWTALPPKFAGKEGRVLTEDELISFLRALPPQASEAAEMYVRMAPRQIDTRYRRRIERELKWTPLQPALDTDRLAAPHLASDI